MTVRQLSGTTDYINCSIGTLDGVNAGACTYAVLAKSSSNSNWRSVVSTQVGTSMTGARLFWRTTTGGTGLSLETSGGDREIAIPWTVTDDWVIVGAGRPGGTALVRGHKCVLSTDTWTHANQSGTAGANTSGTLSLLRIGANNYGEPFFAGRMGLIGIWKRELSDLEWESLRTGVQAWLDLTPDALIPLDQASTATAVTDITGNGADQSAISGTTVVTGDDPPGFNFSVGSLPSEGNTTTVIDLALSATGDRLASGGTGFDLDLALASNGSRSSDGAAAFDLNAALAATGLAPALVPEGAAAFSLDLAPAVAGTSVNGGAAAFDFLVGAASSGEATAHGSASGTISLGLEADSASAGSGGTAAFIFSTALPNSGEKSPIGSVAFEFELETSAGDPTADQSTGMIIRAVEGPTRTIIPVSGSGQTTNTVTGPEV